jgi:hypothetical protein
MSPSGGATPRGMLLPYSINRGHGLPLLTFHLVWAMFEKALENKERKEGKELTTL